jgi:hypothetical protein
MGELARLPQLKRRIKMLALLDKWQKEAKAADKRRKHSRIGSVVKGHWRNMANGVTVWIEEHDRQTTQVRR